MSWSFVCEATAYLARAATSTPEAVQRLTRQTRVDQLQRLPFHTSFEPMRGPVQHLEHERDVFSIPDDDVFYRDLLGGGEVLSARELRRRYLGVLVSPPPAGTHPLVWFLTNASTHACRLLLHFTHDATAPPGYTLRALFVSQDELRAAHCLHETLLLSLVALADTKGAELRVERVPGTPVARFLLSLLGFLRTEEDDGRSASAAAALVRPPLAEMLRGGQTIAAVRRQIDRLLQAQREALLPPPQAQTAASPSG